MFTRNYNVRISWKSRKRGVPNTVILDHSFTSYECDLLNVLSNWCDVLYNNAVRYYGDAGTMFLIVEDLKTHDKLTYSIDTDN